MLRILAPQTNDPVMQGLMSAFSVLGHDAIWLKKNKPAFDAFYEFQPNLVICYANDFVDRLEAPVMDYKATRCVILKTPTQEDRIFGYYPAPAANLAQLIGAKDSRFESDVSFINLSNNTEAISKFIEPYLKPNNVNRYIKIFGNPLPYPQYIGQIRLNQIGKILANSKTHLTLYNEFVYEAWLNGADCIPYRPNPIHYPPELFESADRDSICKWVLSKNTYYDRCAELLEQADYIKESTECWATSQELKKSLKLAS